MCKRSARPEGGMDVRQGLRLSDVLAAQRHHEPKSDVASLVPDTVTHFVIEDNKVASMDSLRWEGGKDVRKGLQLSDVLPSHSKTQQLPMMNAQRPEGGKDVRQALRLTDVLNNPSQPAQHMAMPGMAPRMAMTVPESMVQRPMGAGMAPRVAMGGIVCQVANDPGRAPRVAMQSSMSNICPSFGSNPRVAMGINSGPSQMANLPGSNPRVAMAGPMTLGGPPPPPPPDYSMSNFCPSFGSNPRVAMTGPPQPANAPSMAPRVGMTLGGPPPPRASHAYVAPEFEYPETRPPAPPRAFGEGTTADDVLLAHGFLHRNEYAARQRVASAVSAVEEEVRAMTEEIIAAGCEEDLAATLGELRDVVEMCRLGVASPGSAAAVLARGVQRLTLLREHESRETQRGYAGYLVDERSALLQQCLQLRLRGTITGAEHEARMAAVEVEMAQLEEDAEGRARLSGDGDDVVMDDEVSRHMKVFVSSTFRDMAAEREWVMKEVLPAVQREVCDPRGVLLTAVDLRWGITTEQSNSGDTIAICMAEIDRCRPHFVCMLGQRYGWASSQGPRDELLQRTLDRAAVHHGWIHARRDASVTELEVRHAVLNTPTEEVLASSLFLFRSDGTDDDPRLTALKAEILGAGCRVVPYATSLSFIADLTAHLTKLVTSRFPAAVAPDRDAEETSVHRAYARAKVTAYVGGERYYRTLQRVLRACDGRAVCVSAEPGMGKSALLAYAAARYRADTPRALVIEHYVGATTEGQTLGRILQRICLAIQKRYGSQDSEILAGEIPTSVMGLIEKLPWWLSQGARMGPMMLVIDGLNELADADDAHSLRWLPVVAPRNVLIVASAAAGTAPHSVLLQRKCADVRVRPLSREDRVGLSRRYLTLHHKHLSGPQLASVADNTACGSPLYLRILLEELRQFGNFEALDKKISECLASRDVPALLAHVLGRIEMDVGEALVRTALCLVCAARRGLSETDLFACLGVASHAEVSKVLLPLRAFLSESGGYLTPFHDHVRQMIWSTHLSKRSKEIHTTLATYFASTASEARRWEELPYHLERLGAWSRLQSEVLHNIPTFMALFENSRFELYSYFRGVRDSILGAVGTLYETVRRHTKELPGKEAVIILHAAGKLLEENSAFGEAEALYREALRVSPTDSLAACCDRIGYLCRIQGRFEDAVPVLRRALELRGADNARDLASATNALAMCYRKMGRYDDAEPLYQSALALRMKHLGSTHADVGQSYNSLACLNQDKGNFTVSEDYYRRALEIREGNFGGRHPDVAMTLFNLAMLLTTMGRYAEARPLMERSLVVYEAAYGAVHGEVAQVLNGLAGIHMETGSYGIAEGMYRKALTMRRQVYGPTHPDVALSLNDMAVLYTRMREEGKARGLYEEALAVRTSVLGRCHPDTAQSINNLAFVLSSLGEYEEAEGLLIEAEAVLMAVYKDAEHPDMAQTLNNLAALQQRQGKPYPEVAAVYERVTRILERRYPELHPDIAMTLNNRAVLALVHGHADEAKRLYHKALDVYIKVFGEVHPEVGAALKNLSDYYRHVGDGAMAARYMDDAVKAGYVS